MIDIIPNWHPIFVHFTVALITISGVFFVVAELFSGSKFGDELLATARWTLWAGGSFTIATVAAGFIAYYSVVHDTPSHLAMTAHRNWALATFAGILLCVGWSLVRYRNKLKPTLSFIFAMLVILILLALTAWRGGELVYRHGLGVMSMPQADKVGHQHNHGTQNKKLQVHPKSGHPHESDHAH